jgi:RNA polymerase-binding transcription factor DksA
MGVMREWPVDGEALRRALLSRRGELTAMLQARMARIREHGSAPIPEPGPDDGGLADLDVAIVDLASATLKRIDQALDRLDTGEYGRCTRCGQPIGEARLRALPFAVRCRSCEDARETEEVAARPAAALAAHRGRYATDDSVRGDAA